MDSLKEQILIDFGNVSIKTKPSKCFEVVNDSSINQIFKIEKFLDCQQLDCGFNVMPLVTPSIKPSQSFRFRVEFTPKVIDLKCCAYFIVKHLYGVKSSVVTKASVTGPVCMLSCSQLNIVCPQDKMCQKKKFEIGNHGSCTVDFQFLLDNNHPLITFSPSSGQVPPLKSIDITASYTQRNDRVFFKRIFCLIEYHAPIPLDVFALQLNPRRKQLYIVKENLPKFKNGYDCFMSSVMSTSLKSELPLLSIDRNYIDFGSCQPKKMKNAEFSVTNHYNVRLLLIWCQANLGKTFQVQPPKIELDVNKTVAFNAIFKPSVRDLLYSVHLEAQLFSDQHLLPFSLEIGLKGHSFEEASCGWPAQYKVDPQLLVLPPCLSHPFFPSHSTMTVHRQGHLPLAYKFHPPHNSNFRVKPEQGLIHGDSQIVIVQFHPKELNDAVYTEKWMLSFNSNEDVNLCFVEFNGSVETPQLIINSGNDVMFPKVHPGSSLKLFIDLYNPTRFSFYYTAKTLKGESVLSVEGEGEVCSGEHKRVSWTFQPLGRGQLEALVCYIPNLDSEVRVRNTTSVVRATCEETCLVGEPRTLRFQQVLMGFEEERGFEIVNNGEAFINGSLTWIHDKNHDVTDINLRFQPDEFTLEPGASVFVEVFVTPLSIEQRNFYIGYTTINTSTKTPIVSVFINSIYPSLQITDLCLNGTGPLFSKLTFWEILQINRINNALGSLTRGSCERICMRLPSYLSTTQEVSVELLLENDSEVGVNLTLSQKTGCDCKPKLIPVSFSLSKWQDNCPHKNQIRLTPTSAIIEPGGHIIMNMKLSFSTVGYVSCQFTLTFTPEDFEGITSAVEMCISRTSIPDATPFIDTTNPEEDGKFVFNMKPVFIGDCYPYAQAFGLYNNTKLKVHYDVDTSKLWGTPFHYIGDRSEISPLSNHFLLFTFLPSKSEMYEAEVTITLSNTGVAKKLVLRGNGVSFVIKKYDDNQNVLPRNERLVSLNSTQYFLSKTHIDVGPMKPTCVQRQVIFLNNKTTEIVSFKWHTIKLPRVYDFRVHPAKGMIQPLGTAECRVVCYSKGWPCHLTCNITCILASFTKYASTVQAAQKHREEAMLCSDYFIITEYGTENLESPPPSEEWPQKNYLVLSATLDIKLDLMGNKEFLSYSPSQVSLTFGRKPFSKLTEELRHVISNTLERILWDSSKNLFESFCNRKDEPLERYIQLKDVIEKTEVAVPNQILQVAMEDVIYSTWQDIFQLNSRYSSQDLRRTLIRQINTSLQSNNPHRHGVRSQNDQVKPTASVLGSSPKVLTVVNNIKDFIKSAD